MEENLKLKGLLLIQTKEKENLQKPLEDFWEFMKNNHIIHKQQVEVIQMTNLQPKE